MNICIGILVSGACCWSLLATVASGAEPVALRAMPFAAAASPVPDTSEHSLAVGRSVTPAGANRVKAPHLALTGRKTLATFGYMKQTSDDRDGLSRLQDQARQLRPPR